MAQGDNIFNVSGRSVVCSPLHVVTQDIFHETNAGLEIVLLAGEQNKVLGKTPSGLGGEHFDSTFILYIQAPQEVVHGDHYVAEILNIPVEVYPFAQYLVSQIVNASTSTRAFGIKRF